MPPLQAPVEQLRGQWKEHGIHRGVLVQPSFLADAHAALRSALRTDPLHLRGVAVFDRPPMPEEVAALHELGVRGARFNLIGGRALPVDRPPDWLPALAAMHIRRWHWVVAASGQALADAIAALQPFGLPIVIDHYGLPSQRRLADCPGIVAIQRSSLRCHMKLSAAYRNGHKARDLVQQLREEGLLENCIWGSDWPFTRFPEISMHQVVNGLADLLGTGELNDADLEANAGQLYFQDSNIA